MFAIYHSQYDFAKINKMLAYLFEKNHTAISMKTLTEILKT